jgi:hypothetical protein
LLNFLGWNWIAASILAFEYMINTNEEGIAFQTKPTFITTEMHGKPPPARLPTKEGSANVVLNVTSCHHQWLRRPAAAVAQGDSPHLRCKINPTSSEIKRMHIVEHPPTPLPWSLALNLFHVRKCSAVGVGPTVEPVEDDSRHIGRPSVPGLGNTV